MKKVFSNNSECIHVFAQRKQNEGRANSVFFYDDTLYSYGYHFPLAKFVSDDLVWINDTRYSNSTSKHQNMCFGAFRQWNVLVESQHNIEIVVRTLSELKSKILKARKPEIYLLEAKNLIDAHIEAQNLWSNVANQTKAIAEFSDLSEFFGQSIHADFIENAKKREADQRRKYTLLFKNAFYSYEPYGEYKNKAQLNYDLVRLSECKTYLETSQNVKVSATEAKALLKWYKSGVDVTGETIEHYEIRSIANNRILIGCHNLKISDIERALK